MNKKGGVLFSAKTPPPPPPPPDPSLARYKPHPFLEETLVGTSKVHTQVLRLMIPIIGVQQSKLLLSWIQVTSYITILSQENTNLGIRSVYVHMHMC